MKRTIKTDVRRVCSYLLAFSKWVVISAVIGMIGGLVGTAFHVSIEKVTELRLSHEWLIFLLPVGGLVIAGLYRLCRLENSGTDAVIESIRSDKGVPLLLAPLIFVGTVITHLLGGSAGREGAALQLGGSIGSKVGRLLRLDEKDMHLAILCGMSGVFSALFGTPLTATLFALEVISVGVLYYSALIPSLVSGLVAYRISLFFGVEPVRFTLQNPPEYNFPDFMRVALLAAMCALLSIVFCLVMHYFHKGAAKLFKNAFVRVAVGGAVLILLTLIFGRDYNGAGMDIVEKAVIGGQAVGYAFVLKMLFTAVTIGTGFKGGEIVPTFFIGATFGCFFGGIIGLDPGFAAAVGLVTLFCAVVNCPIASILLSVELFTSQNVIYFAVACAVGYTLSGYFGLYGSQKIMYSKTRAEFININTWKDIEAASDD